MALSSTQVAVANASASALVAASGVAQTVWLRNDDATNHVYLGASNAVTTSTGHKLAASSTIGPITLMPGDALWGRANAGTPTTTVFVTAY